MREGWVEKCIDECTEIEVGTRVVQKRDGGNTYPVYGGGGETFKMNTFNREDCLIVSRFAMSKCCVRFVSGKFFLNDSGLSVKSGKGLEQCYLNHCLFYHNDEIYNLGKGAAQRNLDVKSFKKLIITIPPISTQLSIASELDKIIEMISKYDEQLKELDKLSQSIFYEMFGDPVENEKGWEVKTLKSIAEKITSGNNAKLEADTYKTEGIPYFRCQNVWKNRIDYQDMVYIDEETNNKMKSSVLKHNDLLITKIGRINTENSSLGRVSIYTGEDNKANLSGNVCYIRLLDVVNPIFVLHIMVSNFFRDYIRRTTVGGTDKRALNSPQIGRFPIILPPLSLQQSFARKIEAIEAMKSKVKEAKKEAETLLAARMQYWFE